MKVLVGSQALKQHIPSVNPNDVDYFSDTKHPGAECFYHEDLEKWDWSDEVASLDELYTIKLSHAFWTHGNIRKWKKHMSYLMMMKSNGATMLPELYDILYPVWEERFGKKKANLEASPEEFFNSNVTRIYEHDSIHASVAFHEQPLFKEILRDDSEVAVSRKKFESLSDEDKQFLVFEEIFATSLERDIIASKGNGYKSAYQKHLMKLITSYSKGWFPLYVADNFNKFCRCPLNYYDRFLKNQYKLVEL